VNTDAHGFEDFAQMLYGILTARRAWAQKTNVLNAMPVEAFKKWLEERRNHEGWK
jgi:histidinol phosphatase-like PHP family hydrolase